MDEDIFNIDFGKIFAPPETPTSYYRGINLPQKRGRPGIERALTAGVAVCN